MKKGGERGKRGGKEEEPSVVIEKKKEEGEKLGEKWKRKGGAKRGGQTTPVLPYWRLLLLQHQISIAGGGGNGGAQDSNLEEEEGKGKGKNPAFPFAVSLPSASARKLAATVWELQQYNLPLDKMHHGGGGGGGGGSRRYHRQHQHHHHHHLLEDNPDPYPASPDLGSASSLRRHVAASLMQHHRKMQRNHHALQPISPASYGSSSMELAPYNPAVTPTSSLELKGGIGETSYSLKTSTELLKVLNRIWSLEEQHAANVSLVRALKRELDLSRAKIKELVRDRQSDRHEMEHLMKQIAQDKQGQVSTAIQSVRDELEDERKLRKRSETLHRKLARELYEVKTSLVNALKDLERERKSRKLLEDLCDEFAWGIKNYEQEMHSLKHINPEKGMCANYKADQDGLILHISESWLDERMQIKQEMMPLNGSVVEKLSSEIEAFLEAKRSSTHKAATGTGTRVGQRRHSLESMPLNMAASAPPHDEGDDDDNEEVSSADSDSHCFELEKPVALGKDNIMDSTTKPTHDKKKHALPETGKGRDPTGLQVKFEEQMAQAILGQEQGRSKIVEENEVQIKEEEEEGGFERMTKSAETGKGSSSKYMDGLVRNHHLQVGNEYGDSVGKSIWKSHPSPVREWTTRLPTEDHEISESSSKLPPESKELNTLKSKLLEARTRGQRSRSRLKGNKVPF